MKKSSKDIWLVAGKRTPFVKLDKEFKSLNAISLSVPVVQEMIQTQGLNPDFMIWGSVAPNLGYSNLAREIIMDAELDQRIPAFTTKMACSTSMLAAMQAASMIDDSEVALVGGVESMSRVQVGLNQNLSDWLRRLFQSRTLSDRITQLSQLKLGDIKLHIPSVSNRSTGLSMGEHSEITAQKLETSRQQQDELALASHQKAIAAQKNGFFEDLIVPIDEIAKDTIPREKTSLDILAKLRPVFDKSEFGTITAGNSSLLTDGAAGLWVAGEKGIDKMGDTQHAVKVLDWEQAGVNIEEDGLLMATTYAIPRILERHQLRYEDIDLWEIHEAFGAQLSANVQLITDKAHLQKVGTEMDFGDFPWDRLNPNGGSVALGHPFGATGARILSQAVKELATRGKGKKAVVSVCADGGLGTVMLLEAA